MNIKSGSVLLKEIYNDDPNRKSTFKLTVDLMRWALKNKGNLFYFNIFRLYLKGTEVNDYLTIAEYHKIHDQLNPAYYRPMLEDKIIFDRYIHGFDIPSPEMLGIVENGKVFWLDKKEFEPLDSIASRPIHAYCKMVTSFGGKNIFKIDVEDGQLKINNKQATVDELRASIGKGRYILQQTVVQHEKLSQINPSCINSLRIYTVHDGEKPLYFLSALRMGVDDSIVDNVSSNNMVTGINENSYLQEIAHSGTNPPKWFRNHPNSNVEFGKFSIPYFKEACDLCCKSHLYFNDFFFIAWDIAITSDGPVMIEGNPAADLYGPQALHGGQKSKFLNYAKNYREARSIH